MPKPIVIEVGGQPQGIVVPVAEQFRFVAVKLPVFPMEGKLFPSPDAARVAAEHLLATESKDEERRSAA